MLLGSTVVFLDMPMILPSTHSLLMDLIIIIFSYANLVYWMSIRDLLY